MLMLGRNQLPWTIVRMLNSPTGEPLGLVSPITAWEIGMAARGKPKPDTLVFRTDPQGWFADFMSLPFVAMAPFTARMAIEASYLPDFAHKDPGDRFLVATARELRCPIVTSDAKILDYAALGHVDAVPC